MTSSDGGSPRPRPPQASASRSTSRSPGAAVESRAGSNDEETSTTSPPIAVSLRCLAAWLDVAPQLVGQKSFLAVTSYWDIRTRHLPVWLDELAWSDTVEVGSLAEANWRQFGFSIPPELPRAFEGSFVSFRWRVVATRRRRVGHAEASVPMILRERQTIPCLRIETSPLGTWRLLEWKSEESMMVRSGSAMSGMRIAAPKTRRFPARPRSRRSRAGGADGFRMIGASCA